MNKFQKAVELYRAKLATSWRDVAEHEDIERQLVALELPAGCLDQAARSAREDAEWEAEWEAAHSL